jgi:hypothetical protein
MHAKKIRRPEATRTAPSAKASGTYVKSERADEGPPGEDDDLYEPDKESIPPISMRASCMELLWVCGDCGEHYPRASACPEQCASCGAPKQSFYAPIED